MNVEKFLETLGVLIAEKNNLKLKSIKIKRKDNVLSNKQNI